MAPIWGIAMNLKDQPLLWGPICKYCNECINPMAIKGPICGYCNECIKPLAIKGPICGYCNECKKPTTIMGSYMRVLQ